jgi:hypothetical protein
LDYSIQQLVAFDYLLVHSDDIPDGPTGLHPKIPQRSGEYLIRRKTLQEGLLLYMSRGLISQEYGQTGLRYAATESSGNFLDSLTSEYIKELQNIADWVADNFSTIPELELNQFMKEHLDKWGTEFITEPALWPEGTL